jgi:hypothetical protein
LRRSAEEEKADGRRRCCRAVRLDRSTDLFGSLSQQRFGEFEGTERNAQQHSKGSQNKSCWLSARESLRLKRFRSRPTILKMKTRECDQDPSQAGMPGHLVSRTVIVTALKYMKDKLATLMTNREIDAMLSANED